MLPPPIPLQFLESGQRGRIEQLVGPPDEVHRLEEIGIRVGVEIEMVHPGSPCIVRLTGHKICFRNNESFAVLVQPKEAA